MHLDGGFRGADPDQNPNVTHIHRTTQTGQAGYDPLGVDRYGMVSGVLEKRLLMGL